MFGIAGNSIVSTYYITTAMQLSIANRTQKLLLFLFDKFFPILSSKYLKIKL
jgi:hypothetical protein